MRVTLPVFVGNHPPECSIEAVDVRGFPSPRELLEGEWVTIVPQRKLEGDTENLFPIAEAAGLASG